LAVILLLPWSLKCSFVYEEVSSRGIYSRRPNIKWLRSFGILNNIIWGPLGDPLLRSKRPDDVVLGFRQARVIKQVMGKFFSAGL